MYLLRKRRKFSPRTQTLSSSRLIISLRSVFAPLHHLILPKPFTVSHRPQSPSRTTSRSLILHQETISLLQNRTPQNHIGFTLRSPIFADLCCILGTSFWSPPRGSFSKLVPGICKTNLFRSTHTISEAAIAHVALHTAPYIRCPATPTPIIPAYFRTLVKVSGTPFRFWKDQTCQILFHLFYTAQPTPHAEYVLLRRWWWYWCMLCYICMYMESDPKPKESRHCH